VCACVEAGVFFFYDLSSIRVTIEEKRRSFGHFSELVVVPRSPH
jgi:hypothetical protein